MTKLSNAPRWIKEILLHWPIFTLALWISSSFFNGIEFQTIESIFISSLILTALNLFIKPIVLVLALPLAVLSFGLVVPFLNGLFILLVAEFINGFYVDSYLTSVLASISVSILSIVTQIAIGTTKTSMFVKKKQSSFTNKPKDGKKYDEETIIDVEVKEKNK